MAQDFQWNSFAARGNKTGFSDNLSFMIYKLLYGEITFPGIVYKIKSSF